MKIKYLNGDYKLLGDSLDHNDLMFLFKEKKKKKFTFKELQEHFCNTSKERITAIINSASTEGLITINNEESFIEKIS
jgi:acyl carrier protein